MVLEGLASCRSGGLGVGVAEALLAAVSTLTSGLAQRAVTDTDTPLAPQAVQATVGILETVRTGH
jgi:hypothetical protein